MGSTAWLLALALAVLGAVGCGEETGEGTGVAGRSASTSRAKTTPTFGGEGRAALRGRGDDARHGRRADQAEQAGLGPNPVRIIEGSCDRPGAVAFQLPALTASGSEKRLEVGIDELYEGDYAVQVLFSKGRDEPMACGDVPDDPPDGS